MGLITRQSKGSKLTITEMDNNLVYLDSKSRLNFTTNDRINVHDLIVLNEDGTVSLQSESIDYLMDSGEYVDFPLSYEYVTNSPSTYIGYSDNKHEIVVAANLAKFSGIYTACYILYKFFISDDGEVTSELVTDNEPIRGYISSIQYYDGFIYLLKIISDRFNKGSVYLSEMAYNSLELPAEEYTLDKSNPKLPSFDPTTNMSIDENTGDICVSSRRFVRTVFVENVGRGRTFRVSTELALGGVGSEIQIKHNNFIDEPYWLITYRITNQKHYRIIRTERIANPKGAGLIPSPTIYNDNILPVEIYNSFAFVLDTIFITNNSFLTTYYTGTEYYAQVGSISNDYNTITINTSNENIIPLRYKNEYADLSLKISSNTIICIAETRDDNNITVYIDYLVANLNDYVINFTDSVLLSSHDIELGVREFINKFDSDIIFFNMDSPYLLNSIVGTNIDKYIGIVDSVSNNTVSVVKPNYIMSNLSNLTTGQYYYATSNGLSTSGSIRAGLAISDTKMIILTK
jgi:hypothetical protein